MQNQVIEFVKAAFRSPKDVATLFPTSSHLAQLLLREAEITRDKFIIELGVGTGAITNHLYEDRKFNPANYLGIELDGPMTAFLRERFPDMRFQQDSVENLNHYLNNHKADVVISSLPWTIFSDQMQKQALEAIAEALKPGGVFVAYMCLNASWYPQANSFRELLKRNFRDVQKTEVEWRNIPPAFVLKATK